MSVAFEDAVLYVLDGTRWCRLGVGWLASKPQSADPLQEAQTPPHPLGLADWPRELIRDRESSAPEDSHAPVISYVAGILALTVAVSQAAGLNPFGRVGLPLTRQDFKEMAEAESPLLNDETIPLGTSRGWANPSSGNSGTITLIDRFATNFQGTKLPCLKLRYHVVIRNRSDPYNLLLDRCQVADSRWKLA